VLGGGAWREGASGGIPGGKPVAMVRMNSASAMSSCRSDQTGASGAKSHPLEEAGSLIGGRGAGQDGMFEGL